MNIQKVKISEVKINPNNPRIIKDDKFAKLVRSIKEFPKMLEIRPIVINSDMVVLGGNMRLKACKEAGLKEVYIILADDLTPEEQKQFIIKDNVGFGEWDWDMLANEWEAEQLEDWGLDIPDFGVNEVPAAEEDDYQMPDQVQTDIVLGDLFEIGEHRLLCGDSTEIETYKKLFANNLADLIVTDPPYNVNYSNKNEMLNKVNKGNTNQTDIKNDNMRNDDFYQFLYDFYTALGTYTKPGGAWYVWHSDTEGVNFRQAFKDSGLLLKQCLVWVKNVLVIGRQDYHWKHEPCLYGWKPGAAHYFTSERNHATVIEDKVDVNKLSKQKMKEIINTMLSDKTKSTIIRCDKPSRSDVHPTMKPILLLAPLIQNSSIEGQLVCDAFLGSGSTMVASHQLKRKCYGMELDPKYCQVIVDRMRKLDPSLVITKNGLPLTS